MCQHMHTMPYPGGLLDQDSSFVAMLDLIIETQSVKEKLDMEAAQRRRSGR